MSRRNRHKNNPSPNAGQPHQSAAQAARRIMREMPMPSNCTFVGTSCLGPGPGAPPPPPTDGQDGAIPPRGESRANATKGAIRSRLCFPLEMLNEIKLRAERYNGQLNLQTCLETWLGIELSRSSAQIDECIDKLYIDKLRVIERAGGAAYDADCSARCDRIADKLSDAPAKHQRTLARSKHGAEILINQWTLLGDAIDSERGISEELRQRAYDLLGIDHVFRSGFNQVPAASDVERLRSLVAREVNKHSSNIERYLSAQSDTEREMAQLGLPRFRDSTTNSLRGDLNRARKRFSWALETIRAIKSSVDISSIIDPLTKKPVAVGPPLAAVRRRGQPAAAAPAQPEAPAESQAPAAPQAAAEPAPAASVSPPMPPLPADCPDERKEMWFVAAGTVLNQAVVPTGAEPGPAAA